MSWGSLGTELPLATWAGAVAMSSCWKTLQVKLKQTGAWRRGWKLWQKNMQEKGLGVGILCALGPCTDHAGLREDQFWGRLMSWMPVGMGLAWACREWLLCWAIGLWNGPKWSLTLGYHWVLGPGPNKNRKIKDNTKRIKIKFESIWKINTRLKPYNLINTNDN